MTQTRTGHSFCGAVTWTGLSHALAAMRPDHEIPIDRRRDSLAGSIHPMTEAQFPASLNIPASPEE